MNKKEEVKREWEREGTRRKNERKWKKEGLIKKEGDGGNKKERIESGKI